MFSINHQIDVIRIFRITARKIIRKGFRIFLTAVIIAIIRDREILASSISDNITSKAFSIASAEAFNIYVLNHDRDLKKCILSLDSHNYYMMNIMDYLTGNTSCEASQADGF